MLELQDAEMQDGQRYVHGASEGCLYIRSILLPLSASFLSFSKDLIVPPYLLLLATSRDPDSLTS